MENRFCKFFSKTLHCLAVIVFALTVTFSSCGDYLDVVPDNVLTLEDIFSTRSEAYNALARVYSYLPREHFTDQTWWFLGDEWMFRERYTYQSQTSRCRGIQIMRGNQNPGRPLLGHWSGTGGLDNRSLYQAIAVCNVFIDHIHLANDMDELEKNDWKAQATFMKAYYHFLLLKQYGPIVIADKLIHQNTPMSELFPHRSNIDECFDYIIRTMNAALPHLDARKASAELGQVDKIAASAIKARVMLFRASPFYSGNSDMYLRFLDHNDQPFFPVNDTPEMTKAKWEDALRAINEAIDIAGANGKRLYTFNKTMLPEDITHFSIGNEDRIQTLYDLRMVAVDPWNVELLWGYPVPDYDENVNDGRRRSIPASCNIMITPLAGNNADRYYFCEQNIGATHKMLHRYYTEHGLPLEADANFDVDFQYELTLTPDANDPEFIERWQGIIMPGFTTINLYLNRELRFYANLGISGGYWRSHAQVIPTPMFAEQMGGFWSARGIEYYYTTGVAVQKLVHTESKHAQFQRVVKFPFPMIRMAELYLMKAEALNELDYPPADIFEPLDLIRTRAGIDKVEDAWNGPHVRAEWRNYHLRDKEARRNIILQERGIELAFEGKRYWDMIRHKRAVQEFNFPIFAWEGEALTPSEYFVLSIKDARTFRDANYLWPMHIDELNRNRNLVQNPGW